MEYLEKAFEIEDYIINLRRELHMYPELSLMEYETALRIERELKKAGITTARVCNTAVIAYIGHGSNTVALRSDMDALAVNEDTGEEFASKNSGVMHACGHDFHMASLIGAAKILKQMEEKIDNLNGRIKLIFQPAEEKSLGAAMLIKEGILSDVNKIFGLHVFSDIETGRISIEPGERMAITENFKITVNGRGGHAGKPHLCVDATVAAAELVVNLQTIVSRSSNPINSVALTIGTFHSGTAQNVISQKAELTGTIRTFNEDDRINTRKSLYRMCDMIKMGYGVDIEIEYMEALHPAVINDEELSRKIYKKAAEEFGEERMIKVPKMMLGEDFSSYQECVPGVYAFVGVKNKDKENYLNHHEKFNPDESTLALCAALHVTAAFAMLE